MRYMCAERNKLRRVFSTAIDLVKAVIRGGGTEGQIQSKYSYRLLNLQRLPIIDYTSIVVLKLLTTTIEV